MTRTWRIYFYIVGVMELAFSAWLVIFLNDYFSAIGPLMLGSLLITWPRLSFSTYSRGWHTGRAMLWQSMHQAQESGVEFHEWMAQELAKDGHTATLYRHGPDGTKEVKRYGPPDGHHEDLP